MVCLLVYHKLAKPSALCYDRAMKKLTALYRSPDDRRFFEAIAELFVDSFLLDMVATDDREQAPSSSDADLMLVETAEALLLLLPDGTKFPLPNRDLKSWDSLTSLALAKKLTQLASQLPLDQLPLHLAISDQTNQLVYHNGRPKDPFLFDDLDQEPVEDWIVQALKTKPGEAVHLLLPAISFEQILVQSYQGLWQGQEFKGIVQQVQDIKPLLASYLKETGQAIVGWSDTTSGASIKNDLFDDEDF